MKTELSKFIVKLLTESKKRGLILTDEKVIPYGVQYKFAKNDLEIPVNIYYSNKKGISTVIGGSPKNKLRFLLEDLLNKNSDETFRGHNWKIWAGTDESGKGDFFGPLVVCGFISTEKVKKELLQFGVKDSKLLKDAEIERIAKLLYKRYRDYLEVIVLRPIKYNELYEKFREQGKKLNEMLAWMHGRIILNLKKKHDFEGVVVDKFAGDKTLVSSLKQLKNIELRNQIRAENDPAVAAASIIARYQFLEGLKGSSLKFGISFPKGAGKNVLKIGKEFVERFGKEKLKEVAKIHFQTHNKIINEIEREYDTKL